MPAPMSNAITGEDLPAAKRLAPAVGLSERPLGAARWNYVNSGDLYRAILDAEPYKVRGLIGFGANLLLSHADGGYGRKALAALVPSEQVRRALPLWKQELPCHALRDRP